MLMQGILLCNLFKLVCLSYHKITSTTWDARSVHVPGAPGFAPVYAFRSLSAAWQANKANALKRCVISLHDIYLAYSSHCCTALPLVPNLLHAEVLVFDAICLSRLMN